MLSASELACLAPKVAKGGRRAVVKFAEPEEAKRLTTRTAKARYKVEHRDEVNAANRASYQRHRAARIAKVKLYKTSNPERVRRRERLRMRRHRAKGQPT